jgi:hypothetical protein
MHTEAHPLAGRTVRLNDQAQDASGPVVPNAEFRVEDWWDRLTGGSWMHVKGNPAAIGYAIRGGHLPLDDEVVYGKIGYLGYLVHDSELGDA